MIDRQENGYNFNIIPYQIKQLEICDFIPF